MTKDKQNVCEYKGPWPFIIVKFITLLAVPGITIHTRQ